MYHFAYLMMYDDVCIFTITSYNIIPFSNVYVQIITLNHCGLTYSHCTLSHCCARLPIWNLEHHVVSPTRLTLACRGRRTPACCGPAAFALGPRWRQLTSFVDSWFGFESELSIVGALCRKLGWRVAAFSYALQRYFTDCLILLFCRVLRRESHAYPSSRPLVI